MKANTHKITLKTVTLLNFATFERQDISFHAGMNSIVGETGSGKSLILDALTLIFGHRADKKIIRKDEDFASVEATFNIYGKNATEYFSKAGYPITGNELVIKRVIYQNDSSKSYINFQQCPLSELVQFSKHFTDLVGQFENQKLLSEEYQLNLLDTYAGHTELVESFQNSFHLLSIKEHELATLLENKGDRSAREEYLKFQLEEITRLNPSEEDELALIKSKEILLNREKVSSLTEEAQSTLSGDEQSLLSILKKLTSKIERFSSAYPAHLIKNLNDATTLLEDASYHLSRLEHGSNEELPLDAILDRLDKYQRLKNRFSKSTQELILLKDALSAELDTLVNIDGHINKLWSEISKQKEESLSLASSLHKKRLSAAPLLSEKLTMAIRKLKMDGATIALSLSETPLSTVGISKIAFIAETNKGEGFFKIKDIASGGELSRILLAIRRIISDNQSISIFLFDEIDTGVGGETALRIGEALLDVSKNSQVIAITHLPQIATFSDKIIKVSKETKSNGKQTRTLSLATEISAGEKKGVIQEMSVLQ